MAVFEFPTRVGAKRRVSLLFLNCAEIFRAFFPRGGEDVDVDVDVEEASRFTDWIFASCPGGRDLFGSAFPREWMQFERWKRDLLMKLSST